MHVADLPVGSSSWLSVERRRTLSADAAATKATRETGEAWTARLSVRRQAPPERSVFRDGEQQAAGRTPAPVEGLATRSTARVRGLSSTGGWRSRRREIAGLLPSLPDSHPRSVAERQQLAGGHVGPWKAGPPQTLRNNLIDLVRSNEHKSGGDR